MDADRARGQVTIAAAIVAAAAAAMRAQLGPGISICLIVAVVLAPVWLGTLREYRFARPMLWIGLAAAVWGATVSLVQTTRAVSTSLLIGQTSELLSLVLGAGMLLWARRTIGTGWTVAAFGAGALVNVALTGANPANVWKYSLAVPVALLVLGIAMRVTQMLTVALLAAMAVVAAVSDSRSMTSFLLLAAGALLWQAWAPRGARRPRTWQTVVWLAVLGLAAAALLQALILDGVLGDAARQRSEAQISTAGSLIAGGRPEMGASAALIAAHPLGYGSGTMPLSSDVRLAKSGMSDLGYDPDNGYVERFMFGGHFELHSVLGDLWVRFGPLGALLVVLIVAVGVVGAASRLSTRTVSGALMLLVLIGSWDALFSPMLTSYRTLALLFAVAAVPIITALESPTSRRTSALSPSSSTPS